MPAQVHTDRLTVSMSSRSPCTLSVYPVSSIHTCGPKPEKAAQLTHSAAARALAAFSSMAASNVGFGAEMVSAVEGEQASLGVCAASGICHKLAPHSVS